MKLKIIENRKQYLLISWILLLCSLGIMLFWKFNLGIDMTWWTQWEYKYTQLHIENIKAELKASASQLKYNNKEVINSTSAYKITGQNMLSVVVGFDSSIDDTQLTVLKETFRATTLQILQKNDSTAVESRYTNIGKSFGDYIKDTAIKTLFIAIIWIAMYVAWTFSWVVWWISSASFASIVIITLFHDVIIASGLYIFVSIFFPEFKIDTFFITALLTILWYSINDTIVIFDRIRANLKKWIQEQKSLKSIINFSINETMRRSLYTSITLIFVLLTIFFFWPESISGFTLVMIFGTFIGTYSSIFLASPLLYEMNKGKKLQVITKKAYNPDDKIVV